MRTLLFFLPTMASAAAAGWSLNTLQPLDISATYAGCANAYATPLPCGEASCTPRCIAALEKLQLTAQRACAAVPTAPGLLRDLQEGRLLRALCPKALTSSSPLPMPTEVGSYTMTASVIPESTPSEYPFSGYKTAPAMEAAQTQIATDTEPAPTGVGSSSGLEALVVDSGPSPSPVSMDPNVSLVLDGVVSATTMQRAGPLASTTPQQTFDNRASGTDVRWRVLGVGLLIGVIGVCV